VEFSISFSALILLGWATGHPACKSSATTIHKVYFSGPAEPGVTKEKMGWQQKLCMYGI